MEINKQNITKLEDDNNLSATSSDNLSTTSSDNQDSTSSDNLSAISSDNKNLDNIDNKNSFDTKNTNNIDNDNLDSSSDFNNDNLNSSDSNLDSSNNSLSSNDNILDTDNNNLDSSKNNDKDNNNIDVDKTNNTQDLKSNIETLDKVVEETFSESPEMLKNKKLASIPNQVAEGKSKKKKIVNILFFLLNIAIIAGILVYNILTDTGNSSPFDFQSINPAYFVLYIGLIIVVLFLDVYVVLSLILKSTKRFRPFLSFKSFVIMKYYDNITPMSVGGQPFMVSYLLKHDISGTSSLSIPMKKIIVQQFSWSLVCLFGLIASLILNVVNEPLVIIFSSIGFTINFGMILFIMLGSTSKKLVRSIAVFGLKVGTKLHIVKNYNKNLRKVLTFINEYNAIMKDFTKNKWNFIKLTFISALRQVAYFCIPFSIYCMFATPTFELFYTFFIFTVMVDLSSSCCPLPGGTGMNEITFSVLFASYLPGQVFWALLLWRFASYYLWLIIGLITLSYDFFIGNKKNEKAKMKSKIMQNNKNKV